MQILEFCTVFSVTAWEAVIKIASKLTVAIYTAKLTLIKNVWNPKALWRGIISVPPLFFHSLTDRDVDFINAHCIETAWPRLSHVLLEKLGGGYELSMEALSRNEDTGGDWGSTGVQIVIPLSEVIVCISTVFMNVWSPSVPVMLPFQRPERTDALTWYCSTPLNHKFSLESTGKCPMFHSYCL